MGQIMTKFNKAKKLHKQLEIILIDCKEFEGTDQYPLIIDSLSRVLNLLNELKIGYIKNDIVDNND